MKIFDKYVCLAYMLENYCSSGDYEDITEEAKLLHDSLKEDGWLNICHGKSEVECKEMGYLNIEEWYVEKEEKTI